MGLLDKIAKPSEQRQLLKELALNESDVEFILLAIKNSMISGSHLNQAVSTISKLQKLYTTLQQLKKKKK